MNNHKSQLKKIIIHFFGLFLIILSFNNCKTKEGFELTDTPVFLKLIGTPNQEVAYEINTTNDGGFICIGSTGDFDDDGEDSIYLVKTDKQGNKQWSKIFKGGEGRSVLQTADGGYILLGDSIRSNKTSDMYLLKVDATGTLQWGRTFGDSTTQEKGYQINTTQAGGFVLIGTATSGRQNNIGTDMYILKTDATGKVIFEENYGLTGLANEVGGVLENKQGNFIWSGTAARFIGSSLDIRVVLADEEGDIIWDYFFGGEGDDLGFDIFELNNGYIVAGTTRSKGAGGADAWLIRINQDGIRVWDRTFGGGGDDVAYAVKSTADGGFIVVGSTTSAGNGASDVLLIKTDSEGNQQWSKTFGGVNSDIGSDVLVTQEGYVIFGTFTFENNAMMGIIKTNLQGEISR